MTEDKNAPLSLSESTSEPNLNTNATELPGDNSKSNSPTDLPDDALDLATKLFDCARNNDVATLKHYIDAGMPLNIRNRKGDSMLMLASYRGSREVVDLLIGYGADVNLCNDRGQSPIAGAVFQGFDEIVRALLKAGADTRNGHPNAMDTAIMFRRDDLVTLFQQSENSSNQQN